MRLDEHNIILKGQNFTSSLRGVRGEEVNYGSVCLRHPGGRVELLLIRQYMPQQPSHLTNMPPRRPPIDERTVSEAIEWLQLHPESNPSQAAAKFGVSRHVIRSRLHGKAPRTQSLLDSCGRLTAEEEGLLVDWLKLCANEGYAQTPADVKDAAQDLVDCRPRAHHHALPPRLGKNWLQAFDHRHTDLMRRASRSMLENRIQSLNPTALDRYKSALKRCVEPLHPTCIFAMDETFTSFGYSQRRSERYFPRNTHRGEKHRPLQHGGRGAREGCTILETVSAAGEALAPTICYKGRAPPEWANEGPEGAQYRQQPRGMGDTNSMVDWLVNSFDAQTRDAAQRRPYQRRVLLLDNASHHVAFPFLRRAKELNIDIVTYPPNSTHATQPHDAELFTELKRRFDHLLDERLAYGPTVSPKTLFAGFYRLSRDAAFTRERIIHSFEITGIQPLDLRRLGRERMLRPRHSIPPSEWRIPHLNNMPSTSQKMTCAIVEHPEAAREVGLVELRDEYNQCRRELAKSVLREQEAAKKVAALQPNARRRNRMLWDTYGGEMTAPQVIEAKREPYRRRMIQSGQHPIAESAYPDSENLPLSQRPLIASQATQRSPLGVASASQTNQLAVNEDHARCRSTPASPAPAPREDLEQPPIDSYLVSTDSGD